MEGLKLSEAGEKIAVMAKEKAVLPLAIDKCSIDDNSVGERWATFDEVQLARLIAIIAMGQAAQAAHILSELEPAAPAFTKAELNSEAKISLTVQEKTQDPRTGYPRWQRDGFIFEAISWIAARQANGEFAYMKDPHVSSTSQGLDGLMLELSPDKSKIERTTVFEDKCTDNPNHTFNYKVIPAFLDRHRNKRSAEIIAAASVLLRMAGVSNGTAARLAAAVTERSKRRYRAAFAVTDEYDSEEKRRGLFEKYVDIDGITQEQRVGACLVVPRGLRDWFDQLASQTIQYIDELEEEDSDV